MQDLQWRELSLVCVQQLHLETFPNEEGGFMWFERLPAGITLSSAAQGKKQHRVENTEEVVVYWYVTYVSLILYENSYSSSSLFFFSSTKNGAPLSSRVHVGLVRWWSMFEILGNFQPRLWRRNRIFFYQTSGKFPAVLATKTKYFWRDVATKLDVFWWDVGTFSRLVCAKNISHFLSNKTTNTAFKI